MRGLLGVTVLVAASLVVAAFAPSDGRAAVPKRCLPNADALQPGDYEGTYSWRITGASPQFTMTIEITGTFAVSVGETAVTSGRGTFRMKVDGSGSGASLVGEGNGTLALTDRDPRDFGLEGTITASGQFGDALRSVSAADAGRARLTFSAREGANCFEAAGRFASALVADTIAGFGRAGMTVTSPAPTWRAERTGPGRERAQQLDRKLDDLVRQAEAGNCGGLACSRVLRGRLASLRADIRRAPAGERECLDAILDAGIRRIYKVLIDKGVAESKAQQKRLAAERSRGHATNVQNEFRVLKERMKPLLEYSKELAQLGAEDCTKDLLADIVDAHGSVVYYLLRAAQDQLEPLPLVEISRQVALLGFTSRGIESQLDEAAAIANSRARTAYHRLRGLRSRDVCSGARVAAFREFRFWTLQAREFGPTTWKDELKALEPTYARCG